MSDAQDKLTRRQEYVINQLDSHRFAMGGIRHSKWATLAASTAMASGALATVVPEMDEVIPDKLPIGGAVLAGMAAIHRRGNRGIANSRTLTLSHIGIAPPQEPSGAFIDIHNGTQYMPPTKEKPGWTVICTDKKELSSSPAR